MSAPSPADRDVEGIAVIGMSGRFPGVTDIDAFWVALRDGVELIARLSDDELAAAGVDAALLADPAYVKARGALGDVELFDARFFGMSPGEAAIVDPQHRLFLECAWEAFERAGYDPGRCPGPVGVFAGAGEPGYLIHHVLPSRGAEIGLGSLGALLGNDKDHLTTRTAYKLDLRGPSVTVQTACSTSLVAVQLACQALLAYQCDMALAGGASIAFPLNVGYRYERGHILSPDGRCRAFDAGAQGTVGGDGVGVVLLKRLAEAIADGDHVHAVILGAAVNNDGAVKAGYTAPSVDGQAEVIAMAHALAGISARTVGYVEAHGTGTPLGDPIEIAALTQAFRAGTQDRGFCAVGSVKTNIGHLNAAAGVAGLIKAALALEHAILPPTLHFHAPNPALDLDASPFYVSAAPRPWPAGESPRRAGVSAFGFGGTNAHAVLEEPPARPAPAPALPGQLLVLSARTSGALDAATQRLAAWLERRTDLGATDLADIAYTLQVGRRAFPQRRALVVRTRADAVAALRATDPARSPPAAAPDTPPRVAFLFPGQGAQRAGMGAGLYRTEAVFREHLDGCAEALTPHLGLDIRAALFADGPADALARTELAQPALFAVEYALAQLWMAWGVAPAALVGHSLGEYVAACLSGVMSLDDALALVAARGRLMQALPPGAMLAVPLAERSLRPLLDEGLSIAAQNGPASCVVSGPPDAVAALELRLAGEGVRGRRLQAAHAFHSGMVEPALTAFLEEVRRVRLWPPRIPLLSNVTGTWMTDAQATDPAYWVRHARATVRFSDNLSEALRGGGVLLEVGPGRTLSALAGALGADLGGAPAAGDGDEERPAQAIWSLPAVGAAETEREALLDALGRVWRAGVDVAWDAVHAPAFRRRRPLPTYPFERKLCWIDRPLRAVPAASASVRSLAEVEADLRAALAIRPIEAYKGLGEALDALCASHVCDYLRAGGASLDRGAVHGRAALARRLGVLPRWRRLLDAMLDMLVEDRIVAREGDAIRVLIDGRDVAPARALRGDIERRFPQFAGLLEFLDHCVAGYDAALTGRQAAIGVLYPDGSSALIDAVERRTAEHRSERIYIALLQEAVVRRARAGPARPLRVLEIGGGQGLLTWPLVTALARPDAGTVAYRFTDVGRVFVDDARQEAARRGLDGLMTFGLLDIAKDPRAQGLAAGAFDVVVAYNVVHAAPDVPAALRHLELLLAPGGMLGFVEVVRTRRWDTLTWGLAEGWWHHDDALRAGSPLLDLERWEAALRDAGFQAVEAHPRAADARARDDHGLLLATRPADASRPRAAAAPDDARAANGARGAAPARPPRPDLPTPYAAPSTDLERRLAALCEDLLGVERVGRHDGLFELGADSLLMLRLTDRVRRDLGLDVPQHAAFLGSTVARLAQALEGAASLPAGSPLVPIQRAGARPPLFFVHPAAGVVFPYVSLARALGPDQPFYGLQAHGLDGIEPPDTRVEEMASRYVDALRQFQPRGPYHLGGFSFGCLVAFEVAQLLMRAGEAVRLLALVDEPAPLPGHRPTPAVMARLLATGVARSIWPHLHDYLYLVSASPNGASREGAAGGAVPRRPWSASQAPLGLDWLARWRAGDNRVEAFLARSLMANFIPREAIPLALRQPAMLPMFRLFTIHLRQTLQYVPRPYPGRVTLFKATDPGGRGRCDPTMGWSSLAEGGVDVHRIPGEHLTLLRPPHVDKLAAKLRACMDEVPRAAASRAVEAVSLQSAPG